MVLIGLKGFYHHIDDCKTSEADPSSLQTYQTLTNVFLKSRYAVGLNIVIDHSYTHLMIGSKEQMELDCNEITPHTFTTLIYHFVFISQYGCAVDFNNKLN